MPGGEVGRPKSALTSAGTSVHLLNNHAFYTIRASAFVILYHVPPRCPHLSSKITSAIDSIYFMRGVDTNPSHKPLLTSQANIMSSAKLFLYDHPVSSYAQKVRMALRHKNIPFDRETPQNMGTGQANQAFSSANPRMEVPALIDGDAKIFDSTTIVMYLEDKFPDPPLLPRSPLARADARMIDDICGTQYEAINWAVGEISWFHRATGDDAKRLLTAAQEQTQQLQQWLETKLGQKKFFNGDDGPGYADFAVAPIVNRSVHLGYGPPGGSALQQWHARISEVPAVKETFAEMAEGAKAMSSAGPSIWAPHSGRRREYRDHRLEWLVKNGGVGVVLKGLEDDNIRFSWPHPKV